MVFLYKSAHNSALFNNKFDVATDIDQEASVSSADQVIAARKSIFLWLFLYQLFNFASEIGLVK